MITKQFFGNTEDGREVCSFTFHDGARRATILNYGGVVQSIVVPDRNGNPVDVVLGHNDVEGYEKNRGYLGALIGRFANRIAEGKLMIDGKLYQLHLTDRGNHHHGGPVGFNKKVWDYEIAGDELILKLFSPDGDMCYPGNLQTRVIYTFRGGELKIRYRAVSDRKTAVNLTNHTYFNLSGEASGEILGQTLLIESDFITPTTPLMIPVGGYRAVKGTPFDFTSPKPIGRDIEADDVDLRQGNGYDHCFVLRNRCGEYVKCAAAESAETGIRLTCFTDMPAVQFYSGNGLKQEGKSTFYGKRMGFCLETQMIPNNVNVPEYAERGNSILDAGEVYEHTTAYLFES